MELINYCEYLKLGNLKNNLETILTEANATKPSYEEFLKQILCQETETRMNNGIKTRMRQAKLPYKKYIEDLDMNPYPPSAKAKIEKLLNSNFVNEKENVVLVGNPGVGKTHLAIGLAIKSCIDFKRVLYVSAPNLVIELREALSRNSMTSLKNKFLKYELVVIDELGYVSFDKKGSEMLFNLLSNRIGVGSTILTTNLVFERWNEIFGDEVLTTAIVDRVCHKSHIIDMSCESYRIQETKNWLSN